jgi:uncharacterized membrane protein
MIMSHSVFGLFALLWLLGPIALIVLIVWAVTRPHHPGQPQMAPMPPYPPPVAPQRETPLDILARRFASGEINAEEFQKARDLLKGDSTTGR